VVVKDAESSSVACVRNHQNAEGAEWCSVCGLPVLDPEEELALALEALSGLERHLSFRKDSVFLGVGDQGCKFICDFYRSWKDNLKGGHVVLVDSSGDARSVSRDILSAGRTRGLPVTWHRLAGASGKQVGYYGLGERLASNDAALDDVLLRSGIRVGNRKQILFLVSSLGGGTGSGASPQVLGRAKSLNPQSRSLVFAVMPAGDEPDSAHFNAYCSLSRFMKGDGGPLADMTFVVDQDRLAKVRGVGLGGEELAAESLLSHMLALLVGASDKGASGRVAPDYLAKVSRSMRVHAFVPCLAIGRSLEIFGGLRNILESAHFGALAPLDTRSVLLSFVVLQLPERLAALLPEETIKAEVNRWNKENFPKLKGSVLQLNYTGKGSDRIDVCLLLGGTPLGFTAARAREGFGQFKAIVASESWKQEFSVAPTSLDDIDQAIEIYDNGLVHGEGSSSECEAQSRLPDVQGDVELS
jgi:hypothetical protein